MLPPDVRALLTLSPRALRARLVAGHPIDPKSLDDRVYHGIALGLPKWVEALTWKKFVKTFHRDPGTGSLRGWNVRIQQSPLDDGVWEPLPGPITFGHYEVIAPDGFAMPTAVPQGLLIHYGRAPNAALDPVRRVRDPLVALTAGDASVLLGWSYVDLGFTTVSTPSFFALMRGPALDARFSPRARGLARAP